MNGLSDALRHSLQDVAEIRDIEDGIRITTQCMYPSNGLVQVTVRGGSREVIVSDDGGAITEVESSGFDASHSWRVLNSRVAAQGLSFKKGAVLSPKLPLQNAAVGVLLVANASKELAQWMFDHGRVKRERDFRAMLATFLKATFKERLVHDDKIVGASNKAHKFANIIVLNDRRLIVDPVGNDASSMYARVVVNLDVKNAEHPNIEQRLVYDDDQDWNPADLNILQVSGVPVVPFSRSQDVIRRIAHV